MLRFSSLPSFINFAAIRLIFFATFFGRETEQTFFVELNRLAVFRFD